MCGSLKHNSSGHISRPTAVEFAAALTEAQALKTLQPVSSRKRKQQVGDLLEGDTAVADHVAGPARKKRGQINIDDSLQSSNEAALRSLILGSK